MSIIDRAALVVAECSHEQHRNTADRVSKKLEAQKERRAAIAEAQTELDEKRLVNERWQAGRRQSSEGDWVEVSAAERAAGLVPTHGSLRFELRRIAADEKKLNGELEVLRRESRASMGELTRAQEKSHQAKGDAEGHARDEARAARVDRVSASSAAGDTRASEAQLTSREVASVRKAAAMERLENGTERIQEKIEEAHEHEHAAIDAESSGGFWKSLVGAFTALVGAVVGVVTLGVGTVLQGLGLAAASIGAGFASSSFVGAFADGAAQGEDLLAESARLAKAEAEQQQREAESTQRRAEQNEREVERQVSLARRAKQERRG